MKTTLIPNDKEARMLVGEHTDSVYIAIDLDGKTRGSFWTPDQAEEIGLALWQMGRRIKRRAG